MGAVDTSSGTFVAGLVFAGVLLAGVVYGIWLLMQQRKTERRPDGPLNEARAAEAAAKVLAKDVEAAMADDALARESKCSFDPPTRAGPKRSRLVSSLSFMSGGSSPPEPDRVGGHMDESHFPDPKQFTGAKATMRFAGSD